MSSDRRQTACASASTTSPSATGTRPAASTARFAPCTASGGCAAIVAASAVDLGFELVVVDEPLAQPDAVRLVGVDARRGPDQLLGLARADDARQPLRAAEVGQDPVLVLEQPDRRAAREHADVARERHLQSRAERVAAHRGDRRVARLLQPRVRLLRAQDAVDRRVGVTRAGVVAAFDRRRSSRR